MPLKYAYHPGNVAHSSATEVAETMEPVARSLGIELIPMRGATSCGAGIIRQASRRLQLTLNARTFAMAEELGLDIITPCAATAGNLHEDLSDLKQNPNLLAEVNEVLERTCGKRFSGGVEVHHLLHVIVDEVGLEKLEAAILNPIDFDVAAYYGPNIQQAGACGGDDVHDPDYLEQVIDAIGGKPVQWEGRTQSVGVPGLLSEEPTVLRQAAAVLHEAKSEGAELIVSACNLSHSVLDIYQGKASRSTGLATNIPVIHLTEMLSFSMGHHNTRLAQLKTRIAVIGD
ncbi:MAG: heterodisulfide reductase-related iron-sulfur binding cluster [Candidatus Poseidoniales archaeon]|jgi:succinate dehydrogenase / fumarate reductase cytochrome b subunit|uniref:CoB-CoM heterodisulfide reductase subunit B n=1 Tax=uncultured marine group II euryarchaeote DeepAnt-15E7 TaxID=512008 RepID=B4YIK0_9ARCH|nr:CoB-CoM heterodisulfide reductase subunit B [uncultured marine group II euryarchaeote DeepAnt-15E7]MDE0706816.1 heterodisulfide reductase-related iron-sulfur binding cluster [Candidatus Poseidoniales archaeon]